MLYNTVLYNTVLYNTVLYNTVLYNTVLYNTVLYNTVLYNTVLYNTVLYNTVLYTMSLLVRMTSSHAGSWKSFPQTPAVQEGAQCVRCSRGEVRRRQKRSCTWRQGGDGWG